MERTQLEPDRVMQHPDGTTGEITITYVTEGGMVVYETASGEARSRRPQRHLPLLHHPSQRRFWPRSSPPPLFWTTCTGTSRTTWS
jgi:hypothetical protein